MPKNAPAMVHVPQNTLDVVPLMLVSLTTSTDFLLSGDAAAQFTLPKEQLAGRGFALQLFSERTAHRRTSYTALWTFDKSTLSGTTLTFAFAVPKFTVAKGTTYALVLYGDDRAQSPSPAPSSTAKPTASPSPSPTP